MPVPSCQHVTWLYVTTTNPPKFSDMKEQRLIMMCVDRAWLGPSVHMVLAGMASLESSSGLNTLDG